MYIYIYISISTCVCVISPQLNHLTENETGGDAARFPTESTQWLLRLVSPGENLGLWDALEQMVLDLPFGKRTKLWTITIY